jgi:hypothetical protein
MVTHQRPS